MNLDELDVSKEDKSRMLEAEMDAIEDVVKRLKCTNPSEIARNTMIPRERCVSLVWQMLRNGRIYQLKLHPDIVPTELKPRMWHFWSIGIHRYEGFNQVTWIIPEPQKPYFQEKDPYEEVKEEKVK